MPDTRHPAPRCRPPLHSASSDNDEVSFLSIPATISTLYTHNRKEFVRFVKFAIVGAVGAAIDFGVLNLMHKSFGWPLLWANTLSVSMAIASNFTWNRLWTYPESRSRRKRK